MKMFKEYIGAIGEVYIEQHGGEDPDEEGSY